MTARRPPAPVRTWATALVAALVTSLTLVGCVAMPTSGPVRQGDGTVPEEGRVDLLAEGPQRGATPAQIVEGFLLAGSAGFVGEFVTAREYLTGEARQSWQPRDGVVVTGSLPAPVVEEQRVTYEVPVVARIDAAGRYTEAPAGAQESVTYELERTVAGEWRIATTPQGLLLAQAEFDRQFRAAPLYFLSSDAQFLVPDIRWFPALNQQTSIARALLAGPSPWLRDAVATAIPEGAQLNAQTVVIGDDGVAQVDLELASTMTLDSRALMLAQLQASLGGVPGVRSVQVTADGVPIDGPATLERGGLPDGPVEMVRDGVLTTLDADGLAPVPGVAALTPGAHAPARDESGQVRVLLVASGDLVTVARDDDEPAVLLEGGPLLPPSVDRFGWAWTARPTQGLVAAREGAEPVAVTAESLDGRTVVAVRMARDATRLAVVSRGADGVSVEVYGVVRDASGTPQRVGEPVRVGATLVEAGEVVWLDESLLGVIGRSTGATAVHRVPVSGPTRALPEVPDLVAVAGGKVLYAASGDGLLHKLVGATWVAVPGAEEISDPAYPG